MKSRKMTKVFNPLAIDYSVGLDIVDLKNKLVYTEEEAHKLPQEIRQNLVMRPRKIGCWVDDLSEEQNKEIEEALKEKENWK
jgi:hypothetical protein